MLSFIGRFANHLFVFVFFLLPLQIFGAILLLVYLPFAPEDQKKLPKILRWFDNADHYFGRDTSVYDLVCSYGWWARYKWLAWRNPINYFGYKYTGMLWSGNEVFIDYNPAGERVGDASQDVAGFRHIEVLKPLLVDGKIECARYYEYYWIYVYPFKKDVCFRLRFGWKIKDKNNPPRTMSQWCFVISPWKKFSGKTK